jgi:TonB family protein
VEKVEPEKTESEKIKRDDPDAPVAKPEKPKHVVQTGNKVVKIAKNTTKTPSSTKTTTDANAKANEAWKKAVATAGKNISSGLSASTKVDMPEGPGGGGVSYAPYGQIVRKIYTDGWIVPDDMADDEASIRVSVTVARDGKVLSARIVEPSGSAAANRSIQNTLDRITTIGVPFPAGAKESQRIFTMTFNLKAKKAFG